MESFLTETEKLGLHLTEPAFTLHERELGRRLVLTGSPLGGSIAPFGRVELCLPGGLAGQAWL